MPPSKGSFITKTSPGACGRPTSRAACSIACGTAPRWNGTVTACATVSPSALQSAAEKSMPSRTTVECAVRKIVVAISSAIDASALPTISCVIGSTRRGRSLQLAPGSSVDRSPGSRRTVQPGRTTTVVSYSSISIGPGSALSPTERARADAAASPSDAISRVRPSPAANPSLEDEAVDRARRPERREAQRADLDRRARARRGPRRAARARASNALDDRQRARRPGRRRSTSISQVCPS